MDRLTKRVHWIGVGLVFLITHVVYLLTMTRTCPFWDSGEFIATSYILGIPHPPGTPLYVLIGRFFSLLPFFPMIATRVNWLSALATSFAAVFTYLFTVEIYRRWYGHGNGKPGGGGEGSPWGAFLAGMVAALFMSFSPTVWDNAIEAEVYALATLIMAMAAWLILRWSRKEGHVGKTGIFILVYYLICLSMGIALSAFLILPGIVLFVLLEDRRMFANGKVAALFVAGLVVLLHPGMLPTLGLDVWVPLVGVVLLAILVNVFFLDNRWPLLGGRGLLTWCLIAAALGISTHFYLTIRALYHNPVINEADPQTWGALWKVLTRDQYKPPNPFLVRKAPFAVQLGKHFWDYTRYQYEMGFRPAWLSRYLPFLLGLVGAVVSLRRDRKTFALIGVSLLIMTLGLVFYLNFQSDEVRDRDYFFTHAYQLFPVWIGLGSAWLVQKLARRPAAAPRPVVIGAGALAVLFPLLTCAHFWFEHDRSRFFIARDFAYNMLMSLKPNAILFTNGDNDTFPLWYLQEVEKIRRDVKVANLSLLNTDWYIRQLRDYGPPEPKVPPPLQARELPLPNPHVTASSIDIGWNDDEVDAVAAFSTYMMGMNQGYLTRAEMEQFVKEAGLKPYVRSLDLPLLTKDVAVARIVEREYGKRPLYLALTVPDQMGLESRLVQKGIVLEVEDPSSEPERVDLEETAHDLNEVYLYRGLLKPDGTHDDSVYKDENAMRLVQNYAAACIAAAQSYREKNQLPEAKAMLARASALAPHAAAVRYSMALLEMDMGDWPGAESALMQLVQEGMREPRLFRLLGRAQEGAGHLDEAEQSYRRAIDAQPESFEGTRDLFLFLWDVRKDRQGALGVLDAWLAKHPQDQKIRRARAVYADSAAILGAAGG